MNTASYRRLGELLVDKGVLSSLQLSIALADQRVSNRRLGSILVERGFCDEVDIAGCLAEQYSYPLVDLAGYKPNKDALEHLPAEAAYQMGALPLGFKDHCLLVAISDPIDIVATDKLSWLIKTRIEWVIAPPARLRQAIREFYGFDESNYSADADLVNLPERFEKTSHVGMLGPVMMVDATDKALNREVTLIGMSTDDPWHAAHTAIVQAAARVNHPGVATVFDTYSHMGQQWTVLQRFSGESLDRVLRVRGSRTTAQTAELVAKIAEAVDNLHSAGCESLWACTNNILLTSRGPVLVPLHPLPANYLRVTDGWNNSEGADIAFMLGKLLCDCLGVHDGDYGLVPRAMQEIIAKCLGESGFSTMNSAIEVAGCLRSYNWVALSNTALTATTDGREELLKSIVFDRPARKTGIIARLFGRAA